MQQPSAENPPKTSLLAENEAESTSDAVLEEIIDEVILGLCFEVHRACRLGFFLIDEPKEDEKKYGSSPSFIQKFYQNFFQANVLNNQEIVDEIGLDVFGQVPLKKQFECVCPNCSRNLAASRFAPHLEKCMGMGRNSSRIASKRIANTGKVESDNDDYDNDSDWNYTSDRKAGSKKKREKNSPRRTKLKGKNGEGSGTNTASTESLNMFANYETVSIEDRKALLIQMCGVISEHTKKMCTRSHRCPQHTDEQRKSVRSFLLGKAGVMDDEIVDIDTFDESDSQTLRDSVNRLWESSNSTNPSPADSASTASGSSTTKKKEKRPVSNSSRNIGSKKNKAKPSQGSNSASSNQGVLNLLGADIA